MLDTLTQNTFPWCPWFLPELHRPDFQTLSMNGVIWSVWLSRAYLEKAAWGKWTQRRGSLTVRGQSKSPVEESHNTHTHTRTHAHTHTHEHTHTRAHTHARTHTRTHTHNLKDSVLQASTVSSEGGKQKEEKQKLCKVSIIFSYSIYLSIYLSFPGGASGKEPTYQYKKGKRYRFNPWVRKNSWRRHGNPLQYSFLENPMDRGAWQAMVNRAVTRWARLK